MAQVNKPYTFGPNTTISSSNVNDNFDTIYDEFNGNITEANLADDAVTENKIADGSVTSAKLASGLVDNGWVALSGTASVSTGYNKGNREYDLTFNTDLSSTLSPGMRLKLSRGTTPPTQCTDLEASSSQYWSKTTPSGITFTDDFTCEAWIKVESYTTRNTIISRFSTTGWKFRIDSTGTVTILGTHTTGAATDSYTSNQSVPLNRWVHVAASLDMSGTSGKIYIDGVEVPGTYTNGAQSSLTQAGNLEVGNDSTLASSLFDGEISDVRVWSAVRTATQIRDNMNTQLVGNETNLVAYFKLNGDGNDSTSNANNLTAQNSATATTVDNPMKSTEYAIVTKVAYSAPNTTVTVFTGTDHNIPNMTLSNPFYSTQSSPFGFPRGRDKWFVETLGLVTVSVNPPSGAWQNIGSYNLAVPVGAWIISHANTIHVQDNPKDILDADVTLSTGSTTESYPDLTGYIYQKTASGDVGVGGNVYKEKGVEYTTQTIIYENLRAAAGFTGLSTAFGDGSLVIKAECAYL